MKQIEATILGQSYMLACPPDGEQLLQHAVAIVDREMSAIRDAGRVKARERIAVLTALNLAYQRAEQARATVSAATSSDTEAAASEARHGGQTSAQAAGGAPAATAVAHEAELERLIRRIDVALGEDGRLL